jgi:hypothetical protein
MRVLRAAFWLRHAQDVWNVSHTAYFLAIINAVEVMITKGKGERCPTCGLMVGKGPTALFEEFLDRYVPKTAATEPRRNELYRVRSNISHGHLLLRSDIPRGWAVMEPTEWEQMDMARDAHRLAQLAIVNWLSEVNRDET